MPAVSALSPVLEEILEKQAVRNGNSWIELHSHMSREDGALIQELIRVTQASRTLEVGMAYGISTLFICSALRLSSASPSHIAIDPFQRNDWHSVGLENVTRAGYQDIVEFLEERSEFALPKLAEAGRTVDFALIDGWHSFDHCLVEFFYIDRLLRVGGIVAFDDADWPGISKLMRFITTLPSYEVYRTREPRPPSLPGRLRLAIADSFVGEAILHPAVRRRTWDLGIHARCVAFRKVAQDTREMRFFKDF